MIHDEAVAASAMQPGWANVEMQTPKDAYAIMAQARYRVQQFFSGLRAQVEPDEVLHAARLLPPGGVTLFLAMPKDAQRHSLNVLQTLERQGEVPSDLAVAALLHDVGKLAAGGHISLWTRGPIVLLEAFAPRLAARLAKMAPATGWRYALWVQQNHAAIGADWARAVGCTPVACQLIARHQDRLQNPRPDEISFMLLLRRLQQADNQN
jgi:hypothetical protein